MGGGKAAHEQGSRTEEALRRYFLDAGYFVVRGPKVTFQQDDITDVDLWLYMRASAATRERTIVDCRDRSNAKALERILWIKGLQAVLHVERVIVATSGARTSLRPFGELHAVTVLDGSFVGLAKDRVDDGRRLTEEEFVELTTAHARDHLFGAWKKRYDQAKNRLLSDLDFDGANQAIFEFGYFAKILMEGGPVEPCCRLLYTMLAFFCVSLDFGARTFAFDPTDARRVFVEQGLRFGSGGPRRIDDAVNLATSMIRGYAPEIRAQFSRATKRISDDLEGVPVGILTEHFSRQEVFQNLVTLAIELEAAAFSRAFVPPDRLTKAAQIAIFVVLDFASVSRAEFMKKVAKPQPR